MASVVLETFKPFMMLGLMVLCIPDAFDVVGPEVRTSLIDVDAEVLLSALEHAADEDSSCDGILVKTEDE